MDVNLLMFGAVACAAGVGTALVGRSQRRAVAEFEGRTVASLADLPQGTRTGLRGRVGCPRPLEDPATRLDCVCFRAAAYQWESDHAGGFHVSSHGGNRNLVLLHETVEQAEGIWLEDDTGSVPLEGKLQVQGTAPGTSSPDGALDYYNLRGMEYRGQSHCIPQGAAVFVEGSVLHRGNETSLTGPLTVDGRSASFHRGTGWLLTGLAVALLLAGTALGVAGLRAPGEPEVAPGPPRATPLGPARPGARR